MKSLYLECNAGISGDMLVAALLDLGAYKEALDKALQSIPAKGFEYKISRVSKAGVNCCDFDVILDEEHANHDHDMAFLHGNDDAVVHSHEHEHHHDHEHEHEHEHHHDHDHEHEHEHHHDHDHEHEHSHVPHEHHHHHEHRGLQEVIAIIDATDMSAAAKELALKILILLRMLRQRRMQWRRMQCISTRLVRLILSLILWRLLCVPTVLVLKT